MKPQKKKTLPHLQWLETKTKKITKTTTAETTAKTTAAKTTTAKTTAASVKSQTPTPFQSRTMSSWRSASCATSRRVILQKIQLVQSAKNQWQLVQNAENGQNPQNLNAFCVLSWFSTVATSATSAGNYAPGYVATTTALFKQKFGTDITEVAKNLDDASKENLQGAKIHTEFNDLDASLVEATQPHSSEIKTYKSFEVLKCLHHPCQKLFLCHRQFKHMSFCDQCRTIRHMPKKCTMCDIKFRPLWNWSIKCRKCRGINTSTFKKCTDCKKPFKTKEIGQKQCKNCIQPQIGKRACQSCSGQFVPQFFSSKNCSICLFRFASKKSAF